VEAICYGLRRVHGDIEPELSTGRAWRNPSGARHTCSTEPGLCGSFLIQTDSASPRIVGFHSHGDNGTETNGFYSVDELLKQEVKNLKLTAKN